MLGQRPHVLVALQVGVLPVVHGSALGQQGGSQALVTTTVGEGDEQAKSEGITGQTSKQLMVQFNDRVAAATEVSPPSSMHSISQLGDFACCRQTCCICARCASSWLHRHILLCLQNCLICTCFIGHTQKSVFFLQTSSCALHSQRKAPPNCWLYSW